MINLVRMSVGSVLLSDEEGALLLKVINLLLEIPERRYEAIGVRS